MPTKVQLSKTQNFTGVIKNMQAQHINCSDSRSQIPKRQNVPQSGQGEPEGGEALQRGVWWQQQRMQITIMKSSFLHFSFIISLSCFCCCVCYKRCHHGVLWQLASMQQVLETCIVRLSACTQLTDSDRKQPPAH